MSLDPVVTPRDLAATPRDLTGPGTEATGSGEPPESPAEVDLPVQPRHAVADSDISADTAQVPSPDAGQDERVSDTEPGPGEDPASDPRAEPVAIQRPSRTETGDERVDRALQELDDVDGRPLQEHIDAADRVHRSLQRRLSDLHE